MVGPIENRKNDTDLGEVAATLQEIFGAFIAVEDEMDREEIRQNRTHSSSRVWSPSYSCMAGS